VRLTTESKSAQEPEEIRLLELQPDDSVRLALLCGPLDCNLRQIEQRLNVKIRCRGNRFRVSGPSAGVQGACVLLRRVHEETAAGTELTGDTLHLFLQESGVAAMVAGETDDGALQIRTLSVQPRGPNQAAYVRAIQNHDINFGIGPAGTGKTYLAVACAAQALEQKRVARLLLVRPAVEAGEKLGFLPGNLIEKIDPYLRPLYDPLYEMLGVNKVMRLIERNVIEVAPLAYMRGRTLNNVFIILDESQNTTVEQMKMFLTRIGFGATAVITGDITQIDLPKNTPSGLVHVMSVLREVEGIGFTHFDSGDVVRHPLVKRIVDAYDRHESRQIRVDGS